MKIFLVVFCDDGEFEFYQYSDFQGEITKMDALSLAVEEKSGNIIASYSDYCINAQKGTAGWSAEWSNYLDYCMEQFDCAIAIKEIHIDVKIK